MRRYIMSVLILVPLGATGARADFVVLASRSTAHSLPSMAPDAPVAAPSEAASPAASMEPRFKIAQGFGDHVPLRRRPTMSESVGIAGREGQIPA
jgi:hypothetical protein